MRLEFLPREVQKLGTIRKYLNSLARKKKKPKTEETRKLQGGGNETTQLSEGAEFKDGGKILPWIDVRVSAVEGVVRMNVNRGQHPRGEREGYESEDEADEDESRDETDDERTVDRDQSSSMRSWKRERSHSRHVF